MFVKKREMKLHTTLVFVFIVLGSFGQSASKAKSILDKVSEETKSYPSITADFSFTMKNEEVDMEETNKGSLIVQGDMYKLSISGVEMYSNGKAQWTFMPDAQEVSIIEAETAEEGGINPATIFTIYNQGFTYMYLGEFSDDGKKTHKIELSPTEEQEFSRIILEIGQDDMQIKNASMFGTDGNLYIIRITKMKTEKKYPPNTFEFDTSKHPDVSVIDMR